MRYIITGLSPEQLRGDGWQQVLHPDDRDRTLLAWAEAVRSRTWELVLDRSSLRVVADRGQIEQALINGETVLVVEDEAVVRSLARRVLEGQGYTVYQAPNGAVALECIAAHPGVVDLILTDIVMPRMSGRELADKLAERAPSLPALLMSGYSGDEIMQRGLAATEIPFLQKPLTPEKLAAAVRDRLDHARQVARASRG